MTKKPKPKPSPRERHRVTVELPLEQFADLEKRASSMGLNGPQLARAYILEKLGAIEHAPQLSPPPVVIPKSIRERFEMKKVVGDGPERDSNS